MGIVRKEDIHSSFDNYIRDMHSNPNLLINGDFRNPVNQRRKSSYNVNGEYTIDRWRFINDNNGTMTINDGYISISNGVANNTYLQYNYDTDMKVLEGEKVTFTIVYKSTATYRLNSFIGSAEEDVNIYLTPIDDWTVKTLTLDLSSWKYSIGKVESSIILQSYDGSSFTNGTLDVKYIKLELGSVATPFIPRLYGEELALCQRYYFRNKWKTLRTATTTSTELRLCEYNFPVTMRTAPTIRAIIEQPVSQLCTFDLSSNIVNPSLTQIAPMQIVIYNDAMCDFQFSISGIAVKDYIMEIKDYAYEFDAEIY